ncbi:MAG: hypothetical protein AAF773_05140 [Cyanobacteria bacterium P01_D01_bin.115]
MPRKPGGSVIPHSEVSGRFRDRHIADQLLAALKYGAKSLEELALFLSIERGQRTVWCARKRQLKQSIDRLIDQRDLSIEKRANQGKQAQDRTVRYALSQPKPAPKSTSTDNGCKVWVDESVKGTWSGKTQADISAEKKQHLAQRSAACEAQSTAERAKFRQKLKRVSRPKTVKPSHVRQFLANKRSATEAELQQVLGVQAIAVVAGMPDVESGGVGQMRFFYLSEATAS